jgi:hypothetical protein
MGLATHLGPWLLGTVKNTTGTTAGTIRNVGATPCLQSKAISYTDQTANTVIGVIPAGSYIQNLQFLITTAFATANPTFQIYVNGVAITAAVAVASPALGATGAAAIPLGTARPDLVLNVGTTDAIISFTNTASTASAGAGTFVLAYLVRQADGTIAPTAFTGP